MKIRNGQQRAKRAKKRKKKQALTKRNDPSHATNFLLLRNEGRKEARVWGENGGGAWSLSCQRSAM
jgi:hypothetical protein